MVMEQPLPCMDMFSFMENSMRVQHNMLCGRSFTPLMFSVSAVSWDIKLENLLVNHAGHHFHVIDFSLCAHEEISLQSLQWYVL